MTFVTYLNNHVSHLYNNNLNYFNMVVCQREINCRFLFHVCLPVHPQCLTIAQLFTSMFASGGLRTVHGQTSKGFLACFKKLHKHVLIPVNHTRHYDTIFPQEAFVGQVGSSAFKFFNILKFVIYF